MIIPTTRQRWAKKIYSCSTHEFGTPFDLLILTDTPKIWLGYSNSYSRAKKSTSCSRILILTFNFYDIAPRRSAMKQFFSYGIENFEDFSSRGLPEPLKITVLPSTSGYFLHKFYFVRPYSYSCLRASAYSPYSHSLTWVNFASMSNSYSLPWVVPTSELRNVGVDYESKLAGEIVISIEEPDVLKERK